MVQVGGFVVDNVFVDYVQFVVGIGVDDGIGIEYFVVWCKQVDCWVDCMYYVVDILVQYVGFVSVGVDFGVDWID